MQFPSNKGTLLREKSVHNQHTGSIWSLSLLFSLIQELVGHWDSSKNKYNGQSTEYQSVHLALIDLFR